MAQQKRGWIIFFSILLGLAVVPLIFGIIMTRTLLNPEYYRSFLDDQKFYDKVTPVLVKTTTGAIEGLTPDLAERFFIGSLDQQQMEVIVTTLLPEGWLKAQVNRFLESSLSYANTHTSSINFYLDLTPIKENLTGEQGKVTLGKIKVIFPDCSLDFAMALITGFVSGERRNSILCNPPDTIYPLVEPLLLRSLSTFSELIPSRIQIWDYPPEGSKELSDLPLFRVFQFIHFTNRILPWVCAGLGLVVILISYPSKRLIFSAAGIPLIAGCLLSEIGILIFYQAGEVSLAQSIYGKEIPEFLNEIWKLLYETGISFLTQFSKTALLISLVFGGVGIVLLIIGRRFRD